MNSFKTQQGVAISLTFSIRKQSRRRKKLSRKLWESSRAFQRGSVYSPISHVLYCSNVPLATQEAKLATAQNSLNGIKGRLRDIVEQQENIALERGHVALDYAVSLPYHQLPDRSDSTHRTPSM